MLLATSTEVYTHSGAAPLSSVTPFSNHRRISNEVLKFCTKLSYQGHMSIDEAISQERAVAA